MAPEKRSMLQLDLKNVIANKSVFAFKHLSNLSRTGAIIIICLILVIFFVLKFELLKQSTTPTVSVHTESSHTQQPETSSSSQMIATEVKKPLITLLDDEPTLDTLPPKPQHEIKDIQENAGVVDGIGKWFNSLTAPKNHEPPTQPAPSPNPANHSIKDAIESSNKANGVAVLEITPNEATSTTIESTSKPEIKQESDRRSKKYLDKLADIPWRTATVKKNDTLSQIFKRNGVGIAQSYRIAELKDAEALLRIKPGQKIQFKRNEDEELLALRYKINQLETLTIYRSEQGFEVDFSSRQPQIRLNSVKATIWSSLLETAESADISFNTMYDFITLFGWQIDFAKDIRSGDQFSIIFEEKYLDGVKIANGRIVAAEMIASKKSLRAIHHADEQNQIEYYAPNGDGVKGSFLRTPIKLGRVTSKFTSKRLHPIKKTWRAHKGVDYGAPRGTPVLATGDGVIHHAGKKGGYGKTVIIRHGGKYDTLYAHLNKTAKGVRKGKRVKQGQVIGYVGSTGLATGPHLHYEFRIHGIHKNPLTVELPKSSPIEEKYKASFLKIAKVWSDKLDQLTDPALVNNQISK